MTHTPIQIGGDASPPPYRALSRLLRSVNSPRMLCLRAPGGFLFNVHEAA